MTFSSMVLVLGLAANHDPAVHDPCQQASDVALRLESEHTAYHRYEPILFRIVARNAGDQSVLADVSLDPLLGRATLLHRSPGVQVFEEVRDLSSPLDYPADATELEPGEEHKVEVVVALSAFKGTPRFLLDATGDHQFKLGFSLDCPTSPVVESPTITVRVDEPGDTERDALAEYSTSLGFLAQFRVERAAVSRETLEAGVHFVDKFPSSRYSRHLREGVVTVLGTLVRRKEATQEQRELYARLTRPSDP
jgi:hypothetical protein